VETHRIALKKLLGGAQSNFYNAGVGRGYSNKEVIEMVEKVTGLTINLEYGSRREGDADSLYASIDKIKKDFGWQPKYDLKEIIKSAYLWHQKRFQK